MLERHHYLVPTLLLQKQYLTLPIRINEKDLEQICTDRQEKFLQNL